MTVDLLIGAVLGLLSVLAMLFVAVLQSMFTRIRAIEDRLNNAKN